MPADCGPLEVEVVTCARSLGSFLAHAACGALEVDVVMVPATSARRWCPPILVVIIHDLRSRLIPCHPQPIYQKL